jgi:hypothetical protein
MSERNIQRKASPVLSISAGNGEPGVMRKGEQKSFRAAMDDYMARRGLIEPNLRMGRVKQAALKAQRQSKTSVAAALAAEPNKGTDGAKVLAMLRGVGSHGATDEQMQRSLRMNANTQRPRRVELVEAGLVLDSQRVRKTTFGRMAVVWVAAEWEGRSA